ncbi:MAG: hypothetical protein RL339_318 [Pseudomonadota bacterium]
MDMDPASQPQFASTGGRRADRRSYDAQIQFRKGTRRAMVKLRDISQLGARVAGVFLVHVDDHFYLTLPGLAPIEARVAWVTQFEFGCEFVHPLNPVILEATLNRM